MTGLKDCKSCQENVSLFLAKRKMAGKKKNEWKFSNQSGGVMYASVYLINHRKSFFFSVTLFRVWFYITANLVRLNVDVLEISETTQ